MPPRVVNSVPAGYPSVALDEQREALVELVLTVRADGTVGNVEVVVSAGPPFDDAAVAAARQWLFQPAQYGGQTVESRIRLPFEFVPPPVEATPTPEAVETPEAPRPDPAEEPTPEPIEVTVVGQRQLRSEQRSASDFRIERDVIEAAPRQDGADVLRSAPGLYVARAEGPAVAHNYMLRGFDAEHGQDIEFRVGGLPINLPSHVHGQGYADLGFLIGETVREVTIKEGVSDPRQGDFAVAGSVDMALGVQPEDRGIRLRSGFGSFGSTRHLLSWAPREAAEENFGAVQYTRTDGFGQNRAGQSGSAVLQHRFGEGAVTYRAIGILHAARSDLAGVVRRDDVDAGRVCFECVYPYPTARAQNAFAQRVLAGLFADSAGDDGSNGQLGFWLGYDDFRQQQNYTGFVEQSRVLDRVGGRGDLIEQQNRTLSLGLTGRHRTAPLRTGLLGHGNLEVGSDGRLDVIHQAQNLLDATVRNQTWDQRVDASVRATNVGAYLDLDWVFTRTLRARVGARGDLLGYDIDDRLGNFAPLTRPQDSYIQGFRRSALGLAYGPRSSAEYRPLPWLALLAAYGQGYRSPQARQLSDGEQAPFSKVHSGDLGVRFDWDEPLQLTLGSYYTHLSDDVAFDASEGRLERVGATERLGAVLHAITRPADWLIAAGSVTFVRAQLLEPPPPTAEEPQPPFVEGQLLPFVPPVVVRADIGIRRGLLEELGGYDLKGRAGVGMSFLSSRPLPYGDFAEPVLLLDALVGVSWGRFELGAEMFNALDSSYGAHEYSFPSDWSPNDGVRPRTPARHVAAGAPLTWMAYLGVTL